MDGVITFCLKVGFRMYLAKKLSAVFVQNRTRELQNNMTANRYMQSIALHFTCSCKRKWILIRAVTINKSKKYKILYIEKIETHFLIHLTSKYDIKSACRRIMPQYSLVIGTTSRPLRLSAYIDITFLEEGGQPEIRDYILGGG